MYAGCMVGKKQTIFKSAKVLLETILENMIYYIHLDQEKGKKRSMFLQQSII